MLYEFEYLINKLWAQIKLISGLLLPPYGHLRMQRACDHELDK